MDFGFLLVFLVLLHLMPSLLGHNIYNIATCPKNFTCQNLISPQFSNPSPCGLCMASCDTKSLPMIKLHLWLDQWFEVRDKPRSNVIKLHDPTIQKLLNESDCKSFIHAIDAEERGPQLISYKIVTNITLFKCRKNLDFRWEKDHHFQKYNRIDSCGDFEIYYRDPNSKIPIIDPDAPLSSGCSPVHLPMRPMDKVPNISNLFDLLTADFDLEWHPQHDCDELCQLEVDQFKSYEISESDICEINNSGKGKKKLEIIIGTSASIGGIVLLVILAFCFRRRLPFWSSATPEDQQLETFLKNYGSLAPKRYHYSDVKKMTNCFETKLGEGGYGSVYKGKLQDGSLVAVKILKESKGNGEEFINEVASISRTSHVNIVTLLGFCVQGNKKALIYEFMSNGSLEKFIYEGKSLVNRQLEWPTLYKIALGIARGLEYLHRGCNTRILHFDIKPQNILLDEDFCPKVSDFGLAKLCTRYDSIISSMVARGTIGYIAPEIVCKNIGRVSHKSDVYSYGMMVLEMVGGRKNVDAGVDHTSEIYFPHWIYSKLRHGEELGLSRIVNEKENEQAGKMLIVSLWCIQTNPSSRPTITNVLEMLEGPLEVLQVPPKPYLYSPSRTSPERSTQSYHVSTLFGS